LVRYVHCNVPIYQWKCILRSNKLFRFRISSNCTSSTFPYKISTQPNNETLIYLSRRKQANSASLLNSFSRISPFHLEKAIPTLTRVFCNLRLRVRIRSILDILGNEDSFSFGSAYVWSSITNNSAMQSFKLAGANASHRSAPPFCCFQLRDAGSELKRVGLTLFVHLWQFFQNGGTTQKPPWTYQSHV